MSDPTQADLIRFAADLQSNNLIATGEEIDLRALCEATIGQYADYINIQEIEPYTCRCLVCTFLNRKYHWSWGYLWYRLKWKVRRVLCR